MSAPSAWANRATENASDASVSTPVTTMFLPVEETHDPGDRSGSVGRRSGSDALGSRAHAHRHPRRDGPAGSGLAARLASIGYEVVIGSRSKYRAMEARDHLVEQWPELDERLNYGDNIAAADCDLVVMATPWDSAATTAQEHHARSTARSSSAWPTPSSGSVTSSNRWCHPAAVSPPTCRQPSPDATSSPPCTTSRPRSSGTSVSRSTPTC